jgi:hypothetical protein
MMAHRLIFRKRQRHDQSARKQHYRFLKLLSVMSTILTAAKSLYDTILQSTTLQMSVKKSSTAVFSNVIIPT